ncbi:crossover junction endonuclease EME1 isoform X2 [Myripristis murdjan]|nr:crossover junction endonuclease EME1 isoform X2 [Myripristis murdjan]XP_029934395.1 crossover junction endonuclease EME1 isoform X2 [Myripristis murdjan]
MGSYSDSTSDLEEEFPVYDFLQPGLHRSQASQSCSEKPDQVLLDSSDTEQGEPFSPVSAQCSEGAGTGTGTGTGVADVMLISSESDEEDASYVPLAQRLKQRQESVADGRDAEPYSPCDRASPELSGPNGFSESVPLLGSHQRNMEDRGTRGCPGEPALAQRWPPQKLSSWAGSANMSPAKRNPAKRTAEEIQASREEALKRREARERQQGDKEALRLERERQKAERKAMAEAAKALRPEECIKHMVVVVDPALLQLEGGGTLLTSLQALGCSCAIEKQPLPRSVSWMRRSPCVQQDDVACVPEAHVVMHMTVDNFIALIHSYTQELRHGRPNGEPTLTSWVQELQIRHPDRILSLVVIELEKYFRSQKCQSQKKLREAVLGDERGGKGAVKRKRKNGGVEVLPEVSRVEVEEALVHLQLHTGVLVRFLSTWKDFSDHISMTTKAVAEAPFKRERDKTGFSFYLESDWAGGQRVERNGKGLLQVWKRQIQQFNRVSPDMASAILAAYPSPRLLSQAYRQCKTEREKVSLLSDLLIRRGEGVTSTSRRVGPELSKRLFLMMNASDPEQTLDSAA